MRLAGVEQWQTIGTSRKNWTSPRQETGKSKERDEEMQKAIREAEERRDRDKPPG
jgi:hypothetical protein